MPYLGKKNSSHGKDVSLERFDAWEKDALTFALTWEENTRSVLDFGCGFGRLSIMLALAGLQVHAYDILPLHSHFKNIRTVLSIPDNTLTFQQLDLIRNPLSPPPKKSFLVLAQRLLHHLPYANAKKFLSVVHNTLVPKGRFYITVSGIESPLANGYSATHHSVERRFALLAKDIGKQFSITTPVCLYRKEELDNLFIETGFSILHYKMTRFGNHKYILTQHEDKSLRYGGTEV